MWYKPMISHLHLSMTFIDICLCIRCRCTCVCIEHIHNKCDILCSIVSESLIKLFCKSKCIKSVNNVERVSRHWQARVNGKCREDDMHCMHLHDMHVTLCLCGWCSERSACWSLLVRVCRAAALLELLMLPLLLIALLLPLIQQCEDDFDCWTVNNIRRSLNLLLTYPDGAPPVWTCEVSYWLITSTNSQDSDATKCAQLNIYLCCTA